MDELIETFTLEAVNVSAAAINPDKLNWLNRHYLQTLPTAELIPLFERHLAAAEWIYDQTSSAPSAQVFEALRTRYDTLREMAHGAGFIYGDVTPAHWSAGDAAKRLKPDAEPLLAEVLHRLKALDAWNEDAVRQAIDATLVSHHAKIGRLGPALRFALTGGAASPALATTVTLVGREACVARITQALEQLSRTR